MNHNIRSGVVHEPDLARDMVIWTLKAEENHPLEARLRYRAAAKRLLRACGLRIISMETVEGVGE